MSLRHMKDICSINKLLTDSKYWLDFTLLALMVSVFTVYTDYILVGDDQMKGHMVWYMCVAVLLVCVSSLLHEYVSLCGRVCG